MGPQNSKQFHHNMRRQREKLKSRSHHTHTRRSNTTQTVPAGKRQQQVTNKPHRHIPQNSAAPSMRHANGCLPVASAVRDKHEISIPPTPPPTPAPARPPRTQPWLTTGRRRYAPSRATPRPDRHAQLTIQAESGAGCGVPPRTRRAQRANHTLCVGGLEGGERSKCREG